MSNVVNLASRLHARTDGATLKMPQRAAVYPDSKSVSDDIAALAEHILILAGLFERGTLGTEQAAFGLIRLHKCASRAAIRARKLDCKRSKAAHKARGDGAT
jgi:hypothetical protein